MGRRWMSRRWRRWRREQASGFPLSTDLQTGERSRMPNVLNLDGIALSQEQGKWRRVAERVGREVLAVNAAEVDREGVFPTKSLRAVAEAGLYGLMVPQEKGGPGCSIVTAALVTEALAKSCPSTAMCYHMHQSTLPLMCSLTDEAQTEAFIAPILRGEKLGAFAMSEP